MAKALQTNDIGYTNNNEYSTNIYDQARILDFDEHRKKKKRFRNSDLHWEQIPRANDPSKPLQDKAVNLLATIVHKLRKDEVVVLNHNYLSRITKSARDQNVNLLKQLDDILDISFHTKITINGKIHRNCYVIKHTQKGHAIIENPEILLAQKHFVGTRAVTPIEKPTTEDKKAPSCAEFFRPFYIYKEEVFENNRSNAHARESSFFDNSNSLIESETPNLAKTKEFVAREEYSQEATIHTLNHHKARRTNQRKKKTNAQQKGKKGKLLRFKQYDEPKDLAYHYPLTAEDGSTLQSKSTRYFNLNAQNEILLAMSRKTELQSHRFASKAQFMAYMGKALLHEMRDAEKTANAGFCIKANQTQEQLKERTALAEREKFLSKIEQQAMIQVSPENHLKAKLANTLSPGKAYNLLSGLSRFQLVGDIMEVHLNSCIDFKEHDKNVVLLQVQAVYGDVTVVNFIIQGVGLKASNSNIQQQEPYSSEKSEFLQLPQGVWGEVSKELIAKYGVNIYKNWFSKLTATIDEIAKTIELKASSSMVQDWVSSKYRNAIEQIVANMGLELRGFR